MLLKGVRLKPGTGVHTETRRNGQRDQLCQLEQVALIGLKKGRCCHYQLMKKFPIHSTSFGSMQSVL